MNDKAFQQFYEANFQRIYRFVAMRISDRPTAEDLVSEIFLKALRAFERYDASRSASAWIFTIARNHLVNHYRQSGRVVTDEDIENLPIFGDDLAERTAVSHDVHALLEALEKLPSEKQQLIRMKYLEELSYEEMAEQKGKDKSTLKVATFRAMKELRALLEGKL